MKNTLIFFLTSIFFNQCYSDDIKKYQFSQSNAIIISEGTRISADLYIPKVDAIAPKLPVIIMGNGWGGTAIQLKDTAQDFAKSGFYVIAFDYRGWGKSEGKLIPIKPLSANRKDTKFNVEVREIREIVGLQGIN